MYQLNAATRLLAHNAEAGKALLAITAILKPYASYFTHQQGEEQGTVWRSSKFKAALVLNMEEDTLTFKFFDKGFTAGFEAEGYNADSLFKDIRFNVTQFKPHKAVPPEIESIRERFAQIGLHNVQNKD